MKALQRKLLVQLIVIYSQRASYGTEKYPISEKCRNQAISDVIIEAFTEIKLVANIIHVVEALIESVDRNELIIDMLTKTFNDSKLELSGREIDLSNGLAQVLKFQCWIHLLECFRRFACQRKLNRNI